MGQNPHKNVRILPQKSLFLSSLPPRAAKTDLASIYFTPWERHERAQLFASASPSIITFKNTEFFC